MKHRRQNTAKAGVNARPDEPRDLRWDFLRWLDSLRRATKATPGTTKRIRSWEEQFRKNLRLNLTASDAWEEILASRIDQEAEGWLYLFSRPAVFDRVTSAFGKGSTFYALMRQEIRAARSKRKLRALRSQRKKILRTAGPRSTFDRYWALLLVKETARRHGVKLGLRRLAALARCADSEFRGDHAYLGRLLRDRADAPRILWDAVPIKVLRNAPTGDIEEVHTVYIPQSE